MSLGLIRRIGRKSDITAQQNDQNLDKIEAEIEKRALSSHTHRFVSAEPGNALRSGSDGGAFLDPATIQAPDFSASAVEDAYNQQVSVATAAEAEDGTSQSIRRWSPSLVSKAVAALTAGLAALLDIRPEDYPGTPETKLFSALNAGIQTGRRVWLGGIYTITSAISPIQFSYGSLTVGGPGVIHGIADIESFLSIIVPHGAPMSASLSNLSYIFPGASIATKATRISVQSGHGITVGRWIKVVSEDPIIGSTGPKNKMGEHAVVAAVVGNDIYVAQLKNAFLTSPRIALLNHAAKFKWDGPSFSSAPGNTWQSEFMTVRGAVSADIHMRGRDGYDIGLNLQSCVMTRVKADVHGFLNRSNQEPKSSGYGVQDSSGWGNSFDVNATDCRHGFTTDTNLAGPLDDVWKYGSTDGARVSGTGMACSSAAFDTHPEARNVSFFNVHTTGGRLGAEASGSAIQLRGNGNSAHNCSDAGSDTGIQFWSQSAADGHNLSAFNYMYDGPGEWFRFGGVGGRGAYVYGGIGRSSLNRTIYVQNYQVTFDSLTIKPRGNISGTTGIMLDGNARVHVKSLTVDLTDFTGASFRVFGFSVGSLGNKLSWDTVTVRNGSFQAYFSGAGTVGEVRIGAMIHDIAPTVVTTQAANVSLTFATPLTEADVGIEANKLLRLGSDGKVPASVLPAGGSGVGITINGDTGPDFILSAADVGAPSIADLSAGLEGREEKVSQIVWMGPARDLFAEDDRGILRPMSVSTLTIRAQASTPYPNDMIVGGAPKAPLTIAVLDGVTINGTSDPIVVPTGAGFTLIRWSPNDWGLIGGSGASSWDQLSGKPSVFTPAPHTHEDLLSAISDLQAQIVAISEQLNVDVAPTNFMPPTISGEPRVGQMLTGTLGVWSAARAFAIEWLLDGDVVPGADMLSFTIPAGSEEKSAQIRVVATNAHGASAPSTSAASAHILPAVPTVILRPSISGASVVGETLMGDFGAFTGSPALTGTWLLDGVSTGVTGATFTIPAGSETKIPTLRVVAVNDGGSVEAVSDPYVAIAPAPVAPPWWKSGAILAFDMIGGRFMFAGVEYPSVAAMVAAGFYVDGPRPVVNLSSAMAAGAGFTTYVETTLGPSSSVGRTIVSFDNGDDAIPTDHFIALRQITISGVVRLGASVITNSATQGSVFLEGAIASEGSRIRVAMATGSNRLRMAANAELSSADLSIIMPPITHMIIHGRRDNTQNGSDVYSEIQIIAGAMADIDLQSITPSPDGAGPLGSALPTTIG